MSLICYKLKVFLPQALGNGIGAGLIFVPSMAIIAQHFPSPKKRAIALGIAVSGAGLSGIVVPIMLNNLFNGSTGFANGVRALGGLMGGMQLVAVLIMRPKYPKNNRTTPSNMIGPVEAIKKFSKDRAYVCMIVA